MKFKIFHARTRMGLEEAVNKWLETTSVSLYGLRFQYCATAHDDETSEVTEYTLAVFFQEEREEKEPTLAEIINGAIII